MIAAAGYLNYSGKIFGSKNKTAETGSEMANKELLDISDQDTGGDSSLQTADNDQVDGNPGEAVLTNGSVSALVAQAKVNREQVRAKTKKPCRRSLIMQISQKTRKQMQLRRWWR